MSSLFEFSSITTKVRAMKQNLLTEREFSILAASENIHEAVRFLKQQKGYTALFSNLDEMSTHRIALEKLLKKSIYMDYVKLYRFSNKKQREYLKLHIKKYELHILKTSMRMVFSGRNDAASIQLYQDFFDRYSQLDISALFSSSSITEFIESLKKTEYFIPLHALVQQENATVFDYEMALDFAFFHLLWKYKDKILTKMDLELFMEDQGSKIDLLNLQWIYRAKKYYHMENDAIYSILIPIRYKLKKEELKKLVEAGDEDEYAKRLQNTYYARHYKELSTKELEASYTYIRNKIQNLQMKKFPYSIAALNVYLYKKETEVDRLTTILEGVRYQIGKGGFF